MAHRRGREGGSRSIPANVSEQLAILVSYRLGVWLGFWLAADSVLGARIWMGCGHELAIMLVVLHGYL